MKFAKNYYKLIKLLSCHHLNFVHEPSVSSISHRHWVKKPIKNSRVGLEQWQLKKWFRGKIKLTLMKCETGNYYMQTRQICLFNLEDVEGTVENFF